MKKHKTTITGIKIVSSAYMILRVTIEDECKNKREATVALPLQGRGVYYTINFLNRHVTDAAGWISDLSFRGTPKDFDITFISENKIQINDKE